MSVTQAQRRKLGEIAKRAGRGITLARVARTALGLAAVSEAMDQKQMAALGHLRVRYGRRFGRLYGGEVYT